MIKKLWKTLGLAVFCGALILSVKTDSYAAAANSGPGLSGGGYIVTVTADKVNINKEHGKDEVLFQASKGAIYEVAEDMGDGWVKVKIKDTYGYIPVSGNAVIAAAGDEAEELAASNQKASEAIAAAEATTNRRENLVNYALQFIGGRYRYGGEDPRTGVDCSGFTRFVMQNGAGVGLNRSSTAQASQGVSISSAQMRPGDLIFYGSGKSINHVALYIGNGQIVHASTYKTGIKVSAWNYRNPVKIVNVLGD